MIGRDHPSSIYLTEHMVDGILYAGERIEAESFQMAELIAGRMGLIVIGIFEGEEDF